MCMLYYNPSLGISTTNVCGYGNHAACEDDGSECQCSHHEVAPPPEEDIPVTVSFR